MYQSNANAGRLGGFLLFLLVAALVALVVGTIGIQIWIHVVGPLQQALQVQR